MRAPAVLLKPAELPPPREALRSLAMRPGAFLLESALADRDFDEWSDVALQAWPELSDAVIAEFADRPGAGR